MRWVSAGPHHCLRPPVSVSVRVRVRVRVRVMGLKFMGLKFMGLKFIGLKVMGYRLWVKGFDPHRYRITLIFSIQLSSPPPPSHHRCQK